MYRYGGTVVYRIWYALHHFTVRTVLHYGVIIVIIIFLGSLMTHTHDQTTVHFGLPLASDELIVFLVHETKLTPSIL